MSIMYEADRFSKMFPGKW